MSVYVGRVNIVSNFYNFTPVAVLSGHDIIPLKESEIDEILPQSARHNINLFYNYRVETSVEFMRLHFFENQLIIFEFELDDLQDNYDNSGDRNLTGYKINVEDAFRKKKIRQLSSEGLYHVVQRDSLLDDIETLKIVRINDDEICEDDEILVNLGSGFYAGPFLVRYRKVDSSYIIFTYVQDNKYTIKGYTAADCTRKTIEEYSDNWRYEGKKWFFYAIRHGASPVSLDVISDDLLVDGLKDSISMAHSKDGTIPDADEMLKVYAESLLTGKDIPEEIRKSRTDRLAALLTSESDLNKSLDYLLTCICDLIIKYQDREEVNQLISSMIAQRPEFVDKIQNMRIIKTQIEEAKQDLELLNEQKRSKEEEMIRSDQQEKKKELELRQNEAISEEIQKKQDELDRIVEKLGISDSIISMNQKLDQLKDDAAYYERHKTSLENDSRNLEGRFIELVNRYSERIVDITFDGFMSSKMLQAAAQWEEKERKSDLQDVVNKINEVPSIDYTGEALVEHLVKLIQMTRPEYDRNTIVNILICISQGTLTVFSGSPGCGKTSICNIVGKALGLCDFNEYIDTELINNVNRYIPVSVERGWTSKRDFVGYYNPLTKVFEESNKDVFEALQLLDTEYTCGVDNYPMLILLDEANLSPMEYYWADFMNIRDEIGNGCQLNLGSKYIFNVPETLHFVATINNDHTTETLSPRLVDRAWIITLPKYTTITYGGDIDESQIRPIGWHSLKETFGIQDKGVITLSGEVQKIYESLKGILRKMDIVLSPRVDMAIKNYWVIATKYMQEDENENDASIVALDYAVAQKVLPKIMGSGDEYQGLLKELNSFCTNNNLVWTADILTGIISRGDKQLKYYQFFS